MKIAGQSTWSEKATRFNERGIVSLNEGNLENALAEFSKAVKMNENYFSAQKNCGIVNFKLGRFKESIERLSCAINLNCGDAETHAFRGIGFCLIEKYLEAARDLSFAIHNDFDELWYDSTLFYASCYDFTKVEDVKKADLFLGQDSGLFLKVFDESLKLESENFDHYLCRGVLHLRLTNYEKAIEDLTKAHKLSPKNSYVLSHRARAYRRRFNIEEFIEENYQVSCNGKSKYKTNALSDCNLAIELDPKNADAHNQLGWYLYVAAEHQKAIKCFEKAVELKPDFHNAHCGIGDSADHLELTKDEKFSMSIKHFTKAIELCPKYYLYWDTRADEYEDADKYEEAVKDYTEALKLHPEYTDGISHRAKCYRKMGKTDLALKEFERALNVYDSSYDSLPNLDSENFVKKQRIAETRARVFLQRGTCYEEDFDDYEKAMEDIKKSLALDKTAVTYYEKAYILRCLEKYDLAIKDLEEASKLDPKDDRVWWLKAMIHREDLDEPEKALECFNKAIAIDPDSENLLERGRCHEEDFSDYESAIADFTSSLKIKKTFAGYFERAFSHRCNGKNELALKDFEEACKLNDTDDRVWRLKGLCLRDMSKYKEAMECLDKAISLHPKSGPSRSKKLIFFQLILFYK